MKKQLSLIFTLQRYKLFFIPPNKIQFFLKKILHFVRKSNVFVEICCKIHVFYDEKDYL